MARAKTIMTEDNRKLSPSDMQFVKFLVETGNPTEAYRRLVNWELDTNLRTTLPTEDSIVTWGRNKLRQEDIQKEYWSQMQEVRKHDIADATEVMMYFTNVMRGELKDQFGLDASLSDRTTAAKELAKRTVDMENRMQGKPDAVVSIQLNWKRGGDE